MTAPHTHEEFPVRRPGYKLPWVAVVQSDEERGGFALGSLLAAVHHRTTDRPRPHHRGSTHRRPGVRHDQRCGERVVDTTERC